MWQCFWTRGSKLEELNEVFLCGQSIVVSLDEQTNHICSKMSEMEKEQSNMKPKESGGPLSPNLDWAASQANNNNNDNR